MSNHYPDEKSGPRKSKVSVPLAIRDGLGDPKLMAKAVSDGQLVNIPAPRQNFFDGVTKCSRSSILMVWCLLLRV